MALRGGGVVRGKHSRSEAKTAGGNYPKANCPAFAPRATARRAIHATMWRAWGDVGRNGIAWGWSGSGETRIANPCHDVGTIEFSVFLLWVKCVV
ncbi:MAG: hypothetical protein QM496_06550 [Verrucomicrobiota bacterium]